MQSRLSGLRYSEGFFQMRLFALALACLVSYAASADTPLSLEDLTPELVADQQVFFLTPSGQDLNSIDVAYFCFRNMNHRAGSAWSTAKDASALAVEMLPSIGKRFCCVRKALPIWMRTRSRQTGLY